MSNFGISDLGDWHFKNADLAYEKFEKEHDAKNQNSVIVLKALLKVAFIQGYESGVVRQSEKKLLRDKL